MVIVEIGSDMTDFEQKPDILAQRLCNEIQLFDLCSLETCNFKSNRFCTDPDMLSRFEKISDEEQRIQERYLSEDSDDEDDSDMYEDEFAVDDFNDFEENDF